MDSGIPLTEKHDVPSDSHRAMYVKTDINHIQIRTMHAGDLGEVLAIEQDSFPTPWTEALFIEELTFPLCYTLVAETDGSIVGYISFLVVLDEIHLRNIAVRRDMKRQGIASRLISEMLAIASAKGARRCTLEVRKTNYPALAMYKKFGFVVSGIRPRYYSDTQEDALVMEALRT
jgi:ribosomal-protein-alanine N-acetyltransferase